MAMRSRRRVVRRRRPFVRRRRNVMRSRRSGAGSSKWTGAIGYGRPGSNNFRKKKFSKSAFKRRMKIASDSMDKHRSNAALFFNTVVTPSSPTAMNLYMFQMIQDTTAVPFWTTAGGLVPRHGDSATTDFGGGDLFIRGGTSLLTLQNSSGAGSTSGGTIKVMTWRARTLAYGSPNILSTPGTGAVVPVSWEPSLPYSTVDPYVDPYRLYHFSDEMTFFLKPGEVVERTAYIAAQKINQFAFGTDKNYRDFWIVCLQNVGTNTALSFTPTIGHNITFTGDRVV